MASPDVCAAPAHCAILSFRLMAEPYRNWPLFRTHVSVTGFDFAGLELAAGTVTSRADHYHDWPVSQPSLSGTDLHLTGFSIFATDSTALIAEPLSARPPLRFGVSVTDSNSGIFETTPLAGRPNWMDDPFSTCNVLQTHVSVMVPDLNRLATFTEGTSILITDSYCVWNLSTDRTSGTGSHCTGVTAFAADTLMSMVTTRFVWPLSRPHVSVTSARYCDLTGPILLPALSTSSTTNPYSAWPPSRPRANVTCLHLAGLEMNTADKLTSMASTYSVWPLPRARVSATGFHPT